MQYFLIGFVGFLGGFSSGLLGVGGGTVFVPLMIIVLAMNTHLAIGTSLLIVIPTAIMGVLVHWKAGMVDLKTAGIIMVFAILGTLAGSMVSVKMDVVLLRRIFAIFLIFIAIKMFFHR